MFRLTKFQNILARRGFIPLLALLAMLLTAPSLWGGLAGDDYIIRASLRGAPQLPQANRNPFDVFAFGRGGRDTLQACMEFGTVPWWTPLNGRFAFWRPLASITHWLDFTFYPNHPGLMHLQSLLWFAACAAAVALLYRRFIPVAWVAGLAALLYVIDNGHGFPVGWLANRNGIMATVFGALVVYLHDRWRRDGWRPGLVAAPACLAVGLACSEAALASFGYVVAHALFLDRNGKRGRLMSLVPYFVLLVPWFIIYHFQGYGTAGTGQYSDPIREPGLFVVEGIRRLPILLLAQLGFPTSTAWPYSPPWLANGQLVWAIVFLAFVLWVLWPMLRRDALARFWAAGMVFSTVPFCTTYPNDRLLFFTGIGGMGLVAQFFHAWSRRRETGLAFPHPAAARVLMVFWIIVHGLLAPLLLPPTSLTPALLGHAVQKASDSAPKSPDVVNRDVVFVNTPADYLSFYIPFLRMGENAPVARHMWPLIADIDRFTVERTDRNTLVFRHDKAFLSSGACTVFRGPGYPMAPGYTVELSGFTAKVLDVNDRGRPSTVEFSFAKPLEDPSLVFVVWQGEGFVPFEIPAIGDTVTIPAVPWNWTL